MGLSINHIHIVCYRIYLGSLQMSIFLQDKYVQLDAIIDRCWCIRLIVHSIYSNKSHALSYDLGTPYSSVNTVVQCERQLRVLLRQMVI
jgi:hypothetical protein